MTKIEWRTRKSHPKLFQDGDTMLVATKWRDHRGKLYWSIETITMDIDEGTFGLKTASGDPCDFGWDDVEYWVPISEVEPKEGE